MESYRFRFTCWALNYLLDLKWGLALVFFLVSRSHNMYFQCCCEISVYLYNIPSTKKVLLPVSQWMTLGKHFLLKNESISLKNWRTILSLLITAFRTLKSHSIANNREVISRMVMNCFEWVSGKLDFRNVPSNGVVNCSMVKKNKKFQQVYMFFRILGHFFVRKKLGYLFLEAGNLRETSKLEYSATSTLPPGGG